MVINVLHAMGNTEVEGSYDGLCALRLTTATGNAILTEFICGGKATPTLAFNLAKEHWVGWWIEVTGLPLAYRNHLRKGHVWFPRHNAAFKGDAA